MTELFISSFSTFHPTLEYTWSIAHSSIIFLDISLSLLWKPPSNTNRQTHSYLEYNSSHPKHCRDSIAYIQLMRLEHICSKNEDFLLKSKEMCNYFYNCGSPKNIINRAIAHVSTADWCTNLYTVMIRSWDRCKCGSLNI